MRSASLYRVSGNSMIAAAVFWAISLLILPRGPANTVAEAMARVGPAWIVSAVIAVIASVVAIGAIAGIYRHFADGEQEGIVLLAAASSISGALLMIASMAIAAVSMPIAVRMASDAALNTPEPMEAALVLTLSGLYAIGGTLMWLGLIPLGIGMLRETVWPRWIGWGAIITGIVEAIAGFLLMRAELPLLLLAILGFAFIALLGNAVARLPRLAAPPAPVEHPATA